MSKTLIINSSNYVTGSGNKFVQYFFWSSFYFILFLFSTSEILQELFWDRNACRRQEEGEIERTPEEMLNEFIGFKDRNGIKYECNATKLVQNLKLLKIPFLSLNPMNSFNISSGVLSISLSSCFLQAKSCKNCSGTEMLVSVNIF